MNQQKTFTHSTPTTDYNVVLSLNGELNIQLTQPYALIRWTATYGSQAVMDITTKTGYNLPLQDFWALLLKAFQQKDLNCYVDILSSQDLQNLKNKSSQPSKATKPQSKSNKRYLILTYMANQQKYHYPLALTPQTEDRPLAEIKEIYAQLRVQLESARASALNDTAKSDNSFSINYDNKKNARNQSKLKEIDQFKSQNQILKAKLSRLQEQVEKKKVNIQIEAAIERIRDLKENIETANLDLVDWKNNVSDQQQRHADIKKELSQLHKKICTLLTTQKELTAKKKGEEVEKELNQVRNITRKNQIELEKLKKQLENSKLKVKELQMRAKKLNSEKDVLRKGGRRGPYSSAGSVRSYNSFSSKKSYGSGASVSSKQRSNYSYNSYKLR